MGLLMPIVIGTNSQGPRSREGARGTARHVPRPSARHGTTHATQRGTARHMARDGMLRHGRRHMHGCTALSMARHRTLHGIAWHCRAWQTAWHGTATAHGTARHGTEAAMKRCENEQGRCRADTEQPVSRLHQPHFLQKLFFHLS